MTDDTNFGAVNCSISQQKATAGSLSGLLALIPNQVRKGWQLCFND